MRVLILIGLIGLAPLANAEESGKKLFEAHCGLCHGIDGSGGRGANLRLPKLKRASDEAAIIELARNGIPGTIMDGAWQLSDPELTRVAAYVHSLGTTTPVVLPGDPPRGQAAYAKLGCASCHIVNGEGRGFGPELTTIGAQRSAAYLREAVVDPSATVPEDFLTVGLKTRSGQEVSGLRVNEDSFTIQIKDVNNRFWSYRKSDLVSLKSEKKSAMPGYAAKLAPSELDDLVAYLASLRGEK
jgi:cytochrome c oxidase cbb3-type subunit 3